MRWAAIPCVLGGMYIGLFSYWWLAAERTVATVSGRRCISVEVHQSDFMYHTQPIRKPAFWFVRCVGSYRYVGYVAAMENSAFLYEK